MTDPDFQPILRLTETEHRIFVLMGKGLSYSQIAERLCMSPSTVSTYYGRIGIKLDKRNVRQLIAYSALYGVSRLKRVPIEPQDIRYKFIEDNVVGLKVA